MFADPAMRAAPLPSSSVSMVRAVRVLRTNIGCSKPQRDAPIATLRLSRRTSVLSPTVAYSPRRADRRPVTRSGRRAEERASLVEQARHDGRSLDAKAARDGRVGRERDGPRRVTADLPHVHRAAHAARPLRARQQIAALERAAHVQRVEPAAHDEPRERRPEERVGERARRAVGVGRKRAPDVAPEPTERIHRHRDDERIVRRRARETEPAVGGQACPPAPRGEACPPARRPRRTSRAPCRSRTAPRPPPIVRAARRAIRREWRGNPR